MDAARWERVKAVFQDTFEKEFAERAALLAAACGDDAEARVLAERLLAAHGSAGTFLDGGPGLDFRSAESLALQDAPLARIGPYRIVRELGRGGMGAVYLAERDDAGFRKTVAIKVVARESQVMLRRFRTETQILAGLEHPGIARLYDGGTTDEGLPYFVMEYVDGENILAYCDNRRLSISDRLQLFRRVCDAVQYAHQSFIVHRDLKPSNILVTADGEPKLLDFGIAKLLNPEPAAGQTEATMEMARLLTPQYASPEQVRGHTVTTASDVYSLGVIVYELVCGQRPYRVTTHDASAVERIVCEQEPPPPSAVSPVPVRRSLRGDVDNIVLKALRKDPRDRYATAADLAADIARHLEGFPVVAQPDRVAYRATKFVRRHRAGVAAATIAIVSLVAGLGAALWQARVADRERRTAERRFQDVHTLTAGLLLELPEQLYREGVSTTMVSRVVTQALEYLDRLAAERPTRGLTVEVAGGYRRMGELQGRRLSQNLGDRPGARASLHKARVILEPLVRSNPGDAAASRELATILCDLARIEEDRLDWSHRCVGAWDAERRRFPADHDTGLGLATAYELLADAMTAAEDDRAFEMRQQAAAIYDDLLTRFPTSENVLAYGALNHRRIGWAFYMREDWPAMLSHVQRALDMDSRGLQLAPAHSAVKVSVGLDHHMLGCYYWGIGDFRSSRQAFEDAAGVQREAYQRDPQDEWVQSRFLHSYGKLGFARDLAGDADAASHAFADALALLKRGHPIDRDPVWQGVLGFIHAGYGQLLARAAGPTPEACDHLSQGAQSFQRVREIAHSLFPDERFALARTEEALARCTQK